MCKPSRAMHPPSRPSDLFPMLPTLRPMLFFHQERMAQSMFGTSAQALPPSAVSLRPTPMTEMYLPLNREYDAFYFFLLPTKHDNKYWIARLMDALHFTIRIPSDCVYCRDCAGTSLLRRICGRTDHRRWHRAVRRRRGYPLLVRNGLPP